MLCSLHISSRQFGECSEGLQHLGAEISERRWQAAWAQGGREDGVRVACAPLVGDGGEVAVADVLFANRDGGVGLVLVEDAVPGLSCGDVARERSGKRRRSRAFGVWLRRMGGHRGGLMRVLLLWVVVGPGSEDEGADLD